MQGFGRRNKCDGNQTIGWRVNDFADGNLQKISYGGSVNDEGWFVDGYLKGPYNKQINSYLPDTTNYLVKK